MTNSTGNLPREFVADEELNAVLVLDDGEIWPGKGIGALGEVKGEVCFNVSMTGYQEIMTDPSYTGQIINFTFPHIGNVGCNTDDDESKKVYCKGVVLREPITAPANFRSQHSLDDWLVKNHVVGISGVDTRALTRSIRIRGARNAILHHGKVGESIHLEKLLADIVGYPSLEGQDLTLAISTPTPYQWDEGMFRMGQKSYQINPKGKYHVVAMDFGIKFNILRCLVENNFAVTVVPGYADLEEVMEHNPDGVFLSNGPGDPFATVEFAGPVIRGIVDKGIPLFGICLGNQLLSLTYGLKTIKMVQGHRGANHPVKNLRTSQVEITSQNHGFCASKESVPDSIEVTHMSLFDDTIEGIRLKDKPAFSVQYHPESSPGPHDSRYLFADFYKMVEESKNAQKK